MKPYRLALVTVLGVAGAFAQAQDVKVNALFIGWYTQMMDNNLRRNDPVTGNLSYYTLGGSKGNGSINPYNENTFSVRRAEIYLSAKITDEISGNLLFDPNSPNPLLLDAYLTWKPSAMWEVKVGQFKPMGYEVSMVAAADLLFTDRAQVARFTDTRDRGVVGSVTLGDKAFGAKVGVGVMNGDTSRTNDSSAQKDVMLRVDLNRGDAHKFGVYLQQGSTNKADKTGSLSQAAAFGTASVSNLVPSNEEIFDNKDKTSTYGAYYAFNQGPWHADVEAATGLLGRRYPTFMVAAGAAGRQHLDQKFLGYQLTGAYTTGHHIFRVRYDVMNYNQGDDWYTTFNPYKESAPGVATGRDLSPEFKEITVGYTYAFKPDMIRKANIKLDYIMRSKNFLLPRAGQTGEQGDDSLVAAFQVWF